MAYAAWSVIAGEQPTAAKWNILGTNDASFNDGTGIAAGAITNAKLGTTAINSSVVDWSTAGNVWWQELGRVTLASSNTSMTIASFTARKYLHILIYAKATGGTINARIRFNADAGNNYADRASGDGSADGVGASGSSGGLAYSIASGDKYISAWVLNIASREKMITSTAVEDNTTGAATALDRTENATKWTNTAAQISRVDIITGTGTGSFDVGSECIVLGHD